MVELVVSIRTLTYSNSVGAEYALIHSGNISSYVSGVRVDSKKIFYTSITGIKPCAV